MWVGCMIWYEFIQSYKHVIILYIGNKIVIDSVTLGWTKKSKCDCTAVADCPTQYIFIFDIQNVDIWMNGEVYYYKIF